MLESQDGTEKAPKKQLRGDHLNAVSKISILVGNVIPVANLELQIKCMEKKMVELQERFDNLNSGRMETKMPKSRKRKRIIV